MIYYNIINQNANKTLCQKNTKHDIHCLKDMRVAHNVTP